MPPSSGRSHRGAERSIDDESGRGLGSKLGGARVVSADGILHRLPDDFEPRRLRAMLTANDGEKIEE
jgi:hypothetical protein